MGIGAHNSSSTFQPPLHGANFPRRVFVMLGLFKAFAGRQGRKHQTTIVYLYFAYHSQNGFILALVAFAHYLLQWLPQLKPHNRPILRTSASFASITSSCMKPKCSTPNFPTRVTRKARFCIACTTKAGKTRK